MTYRHRTALVALIFSVLFSSTASAAIYVVTTLTDGGAGSLRQAILDANAAPGADSIIVATNGTITLTSPLPPITESVVVEGGGLIAVSGNNLYRVFFVQGGLVTLQNFFVVNGRAKGGDGGLANGGGGGGGGGGLGGGFAMNGGTVTLQNMSFSGNQAVGGNGGAGNSIGGGSGGGGGTDGNGGGGTGGAINGQSAAGSPGTFGDAGWGVNASFQSVQGGAGINGTGGNGGAGGGGAGAGAGFGSPSIGGFGGGGGGGIFGAGGTAGFGGGNGGGSNNIAGNGGAGCGGAVFQRGGDLSIINCAFVGNSATRGTGTANGVGKGGAIYALSGASITLSTISFTTNTASDASAIDSDNNNYFGPVSSVATVVVDNGNDAGAGSLRQAIADVATGGTITFAPGVTTVSLTSGQLTISKSLTIQGPFGNLLTVAGNASSRIFEITSGNVEFANLKITGGSLASGSGAGVSNAGVMTLNNCEIIANTGVRGGGASNTGTMTLTNCTISNNTVDFSPGKAAGLNNEGVMTLTNCTVSGNVAADDGGGFEVNAGSTTTIINCTITGNQANSSPGEGGGIFNILGGTIFMKNSIVAGNTANSTPNIFGAVISQGGNLSNENLSQLDQPSDLNGVDPLLGALANNGGPTPTHALLATSPAIDAGDNASAPPTDQRGLPRITDGDKNGTASIDIGAFEAPPQSTWTPVTLPGAPQQTFNGVVASDGGQFVAVGDSGRIYASVNGSSWTLNSPPDFNALGFATVPDLKSIIVEAAFNPAAKGNGMQSAQGFGSAVAVGVGGTILRSNDGGTSWQSVASGTGNDLLSVSSVSTVQSGKGNGTQSAQGFGSAVAVGVGGTILRSTDDGASWQSITPNYGALGLTPVALQGVAVSSGLISASKGAQASGTNGFGSAVAVGVGGTILRSTDGTTWTSVSSGTAGGLNAVAIINDGTQEKNNGAQSAQGFGSAVAVGVGGTILRSTDGTIWTDISSSIDLALKAAQAERRQAKGDAAAAVIADFKAISLVSATEWYIGGAAGTVFRTTNGGTDWENFSVQGSADIQSIAVLPSGVGVLAGSSGNLFSTLTGGNPLATDDASPSAKPSSFALQQNYPNPFNPATTIRYQLPVGTAVSLKVFDVLGRQVATLVDAKQAAGNYAATFNARGLSSGVYFYRLQTDASVLTMKMLLLK